MADVEVPSDVLDVGPWDIALLISFVCVVAYWIINKKLQPTSEVHRIDLSASLQPGSGNATVEHVGIVANMKKTGKTVAIFYGSQTGTGEEFSQRLAKDAQKYKIKCGVYDPEEYEMDELIELKDEIPNAVVIFVVATYGEGDPTDNALPLFEWLKEEQDLNALNFAVFALGNKTYEYYQGFGRYVDKRCEELGGLRIVERGEGDDDGNIEDDFMQWREKFWEAMCSFYGIQSDKRSLSECSSVRDYQLKVLTDVPEEKIFTGEFTKPGAYETPYPPYDNKNPHMAPVTVNRELHKSGDRSCMHIEIDISSCGIRYDAGDHVGIYPTNDLELVESLGSLLNCDLDQLISLDSIDVDASKKHPFPCPCTYRTALMHYIDIAMPVKSHVLVELLPYCSSEHDIAKMQSLMGNTEEGRNTYNEWIVKDHRHIVAVLEDIPTCKPPLDLLLEMLPRLQCRYYSISSSSKQHKNSIHVTAVLTDWVTPTGRRQKGVCTSWFKTKNPTDTHIPKMPVFVRHTTFRLPVKRELPVLMIGPGTGLAPFRGFLQERNHYKSEGVAVGDTTLYFGCRSRSQDYLYEEELNEYVASGVITQLHLAFSRDQPEKIYVTHLLRAHLEDVWDVIKRGGYLYVCGDAKNMAKDVNEIFLDALMTCGGKTTEQATNFLKSLSNKGRYQVDVWS